MPSGLRYAAAWMLGKRAGGLQKLSLPRLTGEGEAPALELQAGGETWTWPPDSSVVVFFRPDGCILHSLDSLPVANPQAWSDLDTWLIFKNLLRLDAWGLAQFQN